MPDRFRHALLAEARSTPWSMERTRLDALAWALARYARGGTEADVRAVAGVEDGRVDANAVRRAAGDIVVIPVQGVMLYRTSPLLELFGLGVSQDRLAMRVRAAGADPSVKAIVLDIDSPGGSSVGGQELWSEVYALRGKKPVIAVANALAASAAYHLASAAEEIVVTPSGMAGSIGTYIMHVDVSRALDAEGIAVTFLQAGRYKTDGNMYAPLSDSAREEMQGIVDAYYGYFVGDVAKGRGISPAKVRSDYGEGRVLLPRQALEVGMVDRIETFDQVLARLGTARALPSFGPRNEAGAPAAEDGAATASADDIGATETETVGEDGSAGPAAGDQASDDDPAAVLAADADDFDIRRRRMRLHEHT